MQSAEFQRIADNIFKLPARADARAHVLCFPAAGGWFSAFGSWIDLLGDDIELWAVTLPGHGIRLHEPPVPDMRALARSVAADLLGFEHLPYAVFGHSMGGLLAYETIRELLRRNYPSPQGFGVSAVRAPHCWSEPGDWREEEAVLTRVRRVAAVPERVLGSQRLRSTLLPAFQADFVATDNYQASPAPPLPVPLFAWAGKADPVTRPADVELWRDCTRSRFHLTLLDAGHSFLAEQAGTIVRSLVSTLDNQVPDEES